MLAIGGAAIDATRDPVLDAEKTAASMKADELLATAKTILDGQHLPRDGIWNLADVGHCKKNIEKALRSCKPAS